NTALIHRMFAESGVEPLWTREPLPPSPDPHPLPRGGQAIEEALAVRLDEMGQLLSNLNRKVGTEVPELARGFNPRQALLALLRTEDLFRLDRVVNGRREEPRQADDEEDRDDPVSREGFVGMLNNRRNQPAQPPGVST